MLGKTATAIDYSFLSSCQNWLFACSKPKRAERERAASQSTSGPYPTSNNVATADYVLDRIMYCKEALWRSISNVIVDRHRVLMHRRQGTNGLHKGTNVGSPPKTSPPRGESNAE